MDFPNKRKEYSGTGNPLYVSDIVNLSEGIMKAMKALAGLGDTDFAIISGFEYTPTGGGSYAPGICYMNGVFYYSNATLVEGKYLAPSVTDYQSKTYADLVARYTYQINYAVTSNTQVDGMPQFSGNMNAYRLNLKKINDSLADYGKPADLGSKSAPDYSDADLILDNNRHYIDLSSKIPVGTKYVLLHIYMLSDNIGGYYIFFFLNGNTSDWNVSRADGGSVRFADFWVPVDSNRRLGYKSNGGVFYITIGGTM